MPQIRRLLIALALTPHGRSLTTGSRLAADQALRLASDADAAVVLYHSSAADEVWDAQQGDYVHVPDGLADPATRVLEGVRDEFRRAGVPVDLTASEDPAWLGIVRRVLRGDVDLVVAGKRNETEGGGHRIGSVAMKLLRKCPCAVWVAKPGSSAVPQRVLAASDLSPVGERVVAHAGWVAEHYGAALHLVHSLQLPLAVQLEGDEALAAFELREREEHRARLERQVAESKFRGEVRYHIGLTSPSRAILECVERLEPDLVVMGTVSRGGIAGLLVGNTAERLLGRLDVSLLTVKPADFVCPVAPA